MEFESSKTAVFVEAIQALAKEQCDKIDRETEEIRKQRIDAMQESAKARYDAYTEYETARINAEFNREISKLTETSRGQLTQQRSEIFDRVFAAVDEKLRAFVQTPAYRDLLLASAKKLASALSGDAVTLYLRPADLKKILKRNFPLRPLWRIPTKSAWAAFVPRARVPNSCLMIRSTHVWKRAKRSS